MFKKKKKLMIVIECLDDPIIQDEPKWYDPLMDHVGSMIDRIGAGLIDNVSKNLKFDIHCDERNLKPSIRWSFDYKK